VTSTDELEVKGMHNRPDLPTSLACREQVVLNLVGNGAKRVTIDKAKVREEDSHENGAPKDLVNRDLASNVLGRLSWNLLV
jgi:hypothetical protein